MSNASNSTWKCDPWYSQVGAMLELPIYYLVAPLQLVSGLSLNSIYLLAFYRQAKKEGAYWYQILITLLKWVGTVFNFLYGLACIFFWGRVNYARVRAYFVLMWYGAHLAVPLCHMISTTVVLLAMCMSFDRLWAVSRPFSYRNLNHRRHQFGTFVCCVFVGVLASLFDCFRYNLVQTRIGGPHNLQPNTAVLGSALGEAAVWFRNALRLVNVLAMVIINVLVIRAYKRRVTQVRTMVSQIPHKEKRAVNDEMTLVLLTATQCLFVSVIVVLTSIYYAATYAISTFDKCETTFWTPVLDASVMISNTLEYFAIVVVSKKFRQMLAEHVPCFKLLC